MRGLLKPAAISVRPQLSSPMADLIVQAAVKEELGEMNVASDLYDALDDEVSELLEDASRRAEENDRRTVQPRDL